MFLRARPLVVVFALVGCGSPFGPARDPHVFFRSQARTSCEETALLRFVNEPSVDVAALVGAGVHTAGAEALIRLRNGADGASGTADDVRFPSVGAIDAVPWIGQESIDAMYRFSARTCDFVVDLDAVCVETTLTDWLSAADTDEAALIAVGVTERPARELVAWRDGMDGLSGTSDDQRFGSLQDIEAVPQVGAQTMADLLAWGTERCAARAEVVFTPSAWDDSHLAVLVRQLDQARRSADLALPDLDDPALLSALDRNARRGLRMRVILDRAADDRVDPAGTTSARIEEMGIEVRWVTRGVEHGFAVVDGPLLHPSQAGDSALITGSGSWSDSAPAREDAATLVFTGDARLTLLFQREFGFLWDHGRPVVWNEGIRTPLALPILDAHIAAAEGSDARFSSADVSAAPSSAGPTFVDRPGSSALTDALVQLVQQADRSVWLAAPGLANGPVMDALVAKKAQDPSLDLRVYLDGRSFLEPREDALSAAGISVRYKSYAYAWDDATAEPLAHTLLLVDGEILATGTGDSGSEGRFGNLVVVHAAQHRQALSDVGRRFEGIWETRRDAEMSAYWDLVERVFTPGDAFPLVFPAMALTPEELTFLREAMANECPLVHSQAFAQDPGAFAVCVQPAGAL